MTRIEQELTGYERWLCKAKPLWLESWFLASSKTADFISYMAHRYAGAPYKPTDMAGEPWVAVPALAGLAAREGVTISENCAVRAFDIAGVAYRVW